MGHVIENQILRQIVVISTFLLLLSLLPILLLTALLLILLRSILTLYKTLFYPDYGEFLSGMNNYFSGDSPYENPLSIVSGHSFIQGQIQVEDVRELIGRKLREF